MLPTQEFFGVLPCSGDRPCTHGASCPASLHSLRDPRDGRTLRKGESLPCRGAETSQPSSCLFGKCSRTQEILLTQERRQGWRPGGHSTGQRSRHSELPSPPQQDASPRDGILAGDWDVPLLKWRQRQEGLQQVVGPKHELSAPPLHIPHTSSSKHLAQLSGYLGGVAAPHNQPFPRATGCSSPTAPSRKLGNSKTKILIII